MISYIYIKVLQILHTFKTSHKEYFSHIYKVYIICSHLAISQSYYHHTQQS